MNTIELSIIIPLYNKERTIASTIESVLSQEYKDFELVVVDDGSTDNGCNIVESIDDDRIKLYRKSNGGPSSARNFGIDKARGKWIMFLDADDTLLDNALMGVMNIIKENPTIDIVSCNFYVKTAQNRYLNYNKIKEGLVADGYKELAFGRLSLRTGAAAFRHEVLNDICFVEKYRRYEDMDFIIKILAKYRVYRTNILMLEYDRTEASASHPRKNPDEDYITHLSMVTKPFFCGLIIYRLYKECKALYPDAAKRIYRAQEFEKLSFIVADILIKSYMIISNQLSKFVK